jgi:hypothetical protein
MARWERDRGGAPRGHRSGPGQGGQAPSAFPTVKSLLYGGFVWARGALTTPKRRFPARQDAELAAATRCVVELDRRMVDLRTRESVLETEL